MMSTQTRLLKARVGLLIAGPIADSVQDLGDLWHTRVSTRQAGKPAAGAVSPNKGYVFAVEVRGARRG